VTRAPGERSRARARNSDGSRRNRPVDQGQDESPFIAWLAEQLAPLGRLQARRMFGAQGLWLDGLFIGLVWQGTLYLKSAPEARAGLAQAGGEPFRYRLRDGREQELGFTAPPATVVEEPDALLAWVRQAMQAALNQAAGKPKRRTRA